LKTILAQAVPTIQFENYKLANAKIVEQARKAVEGYTPKSIDVKGVVGEIEGERGGAVRFDHHRGSKEGGREKRIGRWGGRVGWEGNGWNGKDGGYMDLEQMYIWMYAYDEQRHIKGHAI